MTKEGLNPADREFNRFIEAEKKLDIKFDKKNMIEHEQLLELYNKLPQKIGRYTIGEELKRRLNFFKLGFKDKLNDYIEITRNLLNYEKSSLKINNLEKWKENLLKIDQERHKIHGLIKTKLKMYLVDIAKAKKQQLGDIDDKKISIITEMLISAEITGKCIWISRLPLEESVKVIYPEDVKIKSFEYESDWHDEGNNYKQVFIYYNPLKYKEEDIEFKIIEK